MENILPLCIVT